VPTENDSVALVHDYLLVMRGAERTFAEMAKCWPAAPIYTLLYDADAVEEGFAGREVVTSRLQRLGRRQGTFRLLLPFFPRAAEGLPVGSAQTLVSSSSAFALGVRPGPEALHVCYCHSPFRYVWFETDRALAECPAPARPLLRRTLGRIRSWDLEASRRVTHFLANSKITQERIHKIYGRDSEVLYPPVAVERFLPVPEPDDYLLFVGQIVRHKRVEVAIEAAKLAGRPIKIVGEGPDLERLRADQPPSVEFLGAVSDARLADLYARCMALVVPNVEEFGIAAVEAQAAGRPVVAVARGGVTETVVDGRTGILVDGEDAAALAAPLREQDFSQFDPAAIRANAERFSSEAFRSKLTELVDTYKSQQGA
jgi:glycosyltransferase involved in cell wall biosynthesis